MQSKVYNKKGRCLHQPFLFTSSYNAQLITGKWLLLRPNSIICSVKSAG